jgi:hypothetical protein
MGPADAVGSPSFADLDSLRKSGKLTREQGDVFTAPRASVELFDCISDPEQFNNLAATPGYEKEVSKMRSVLKEWMTKTGDNIPENITKDWYDRTPGYVKTPEMNKRGEPVDHKFNATRINNKGPF